MESCSERGIVEKSRLGWIRKRECGRVVIERKRKKGGNVIRKVGLLR